MVVMDSDLFDDDWFDLHEYDADTDADDGGNDYDHGDNDAAADDLI